MSQTEAAAATGSSGIVIELNGIRPSFGPDAALLMAVAAGLVLVGGRLLGRRWRDRAADRTEARPGVGQGLWRDVAVPMAHALVALLAVVLVTVATLSPLAVSGALDQDTSDLSADALAWASQATYALGMTLGLALLLLWWAFLRGVLSVAGDTRLNRLAVYGLMGLAVLGLSGTLDGLDGLLAPRRIRLFGLEMGLLDLAHGGALLLLLTWLAGLVSGWAERWLDTLPTSALAAKTLVISLARVVAYSAALATALATAGIDLSGLAVIGGALMVGVGLGLQRIVANVFGGIVILAERSINPGDIIEFAGTSGVVKYLGVRYTCIDLGDGREHLVPNEDLVSKPITNWTRVDRSVAAEVRLPCASNADFAIVRDLLLAACAADARIMVTPSPGVAIESVGPDSLILTVSFWIADARQASEIRTDLSAAALRSLAAHGIALSA
jgi:small-conductance mechanosensitive channel